MAPSKVNKSRTFKAGKKSAKAASKKAVKVVSKVVSKTLSWMSLDVILGLLFGLSIIFEFRVEPQVAAFIQSPVGMLVALLMGVVLFVTVHPVVMLLYLIAVYELVRGTATDMLKDMIYPMDLLSERIMSRSAAVNNPERDADLEHEVIERMAPISRPSVDRQTMNVAGMSDNDQLYGSI